MFVTQHVFTVVPETAAPASSVPTPSEATADPFSSKDIHHCFETVHRATRECHPKSTKDAEHVLDSVRTACSDSMQYRVVNEGEAVSMDRRWDRFTVLRASDGKCRAFGRG